MNHPHGTVARYAKGKCRCEPCKTASWKYNKVRHTYGPFTVPAQPVRDHITLLIDQGMSMRAISNRAGLGRTAVRRILGLGCRPCERVKRSTAESILSLTPTTRIRPTEFVPIGGSRLRVQALMAIGHDRATIAAAMGCSEATVGRILHRQDVLRLVTSEAVKTAYDTLAMTPGESSRARSLALRKGWVPPLALDEDRLDDPDYQPASDAVRVQNQRANGDLRAEIKELTELGESPAGMAMRLGVAEETIRRYHYGRSA